MGPTFNEHASDEYRARLNRVMDYIQGNLDRELTLEELAGVANFSKYHFHRIFFALMGETLFQFIQRLRLEKAAMLLLSEPKLPVTRIAFDCGFGGSSSFAKSFREKFGMSASQWRARKQPASNVDKSKSNTGKSRSKKGKAPSPPSMYVEYNNNSQVWRITMGKKERTVEVKELPEMTVAYVRHIGPYKGDAGLFQELYERLYRWAGPRGLVGPSTTAIVVYHDNPEVTDENRLRTSACITVPAGTKVDGEVGLMAVAGGRYAVARFQLLPHEYQEAWDWVFGTWLPRSGYVPDDRPCFEMYPGDGGDCSGPCTVDICVPVKPM